MPGDGPFIYLLSDYEEHGSENVVATNDRNRLLGLIEENWHRHPECAVERHDGWVHEAKNGLIKLLEKSDEELCSTSRGWNCQGGWGGVQLHVVKLR